MGMSTPASGASGDPEVMMDINTTPLIDVMLVLLIMLIITIPMQLHAVPLQLPVGAPPPSSEIKPELVRIDIDAQSVVHWQGVALADGAALEAQLRELAARPTAPNLQLRPDKDAQYAVVARVLADTRRLGLSKIGVIGSEQFLDEGQP